MLSKQNVLEASKTRRAGVRARAHSQQAASIVSGDTETSPPIGVASTSQPQHTRLPHSLTRSHAAVPSATGHHGGSSQLPLLPRRAPRRHPAEAPGGLPGPGRAAVERRRGGGGAPEDGGGGPGRRRAANGAPNVPGDGGGLRGAPGRGEQEGRPVADADLEPVLPRVPDGRQELHQGLRFLGSPSDSRL